MGLNGSTWLANSSGQKLCETNNLSPNPTEEFTSPAVGKVSASHIRAMSHTPAGIKILIEFAPLILIFNGLCLIKIIGAHHKALQKKLLSKTSYPDG